jgi:hypothetical protein
LRARLGTAVTNTHFLSLRPIIATKVDGGSSLDQLTREVFKNSQLLLYCEVPTRLLIGIMHLADWAAKDFLDGIDYLNIPGIHAA